MPALGLHPDLRGVVLAVLTRYPLGEVRQRRHHGRNPLLVHPLSVRGGEKISIFREDAARLDVARERLQVRQHAVKFFRRTCPTPFRHTHPSRTPYAAGEALYPMVPPDP